MGDREILVRDGATLVIDETTLVRDGHFFKDHNEATSVRDGATLMLNGTTLANDEAILVWDEQFF